MWLLCLPAIAVDGPALTHTQIAADGRGGRVSTLKKVPKMLKIGSA